MNKGRLVVVSAAAINAPHRAPYALLGRRGWDVHIVVPMQRIFGENLPPKAFDPAPADASYTLHPLPLHLPKQQRFSWFSGLTRQLRALRPDVIFVEYDPGSVPVIESRLSATGARVLSFSVENIARDRWVEAQTALRARRPRELARDLSVACLNSAGWRASHAVACISPDGERIFRTQGWQRPLEVVPLGTDMDAFRPQDSRALRAELGLGKRFVVGYFGRLVPEKGVHLLVEAVAKLGEDVVLLLDMFRNFAPGSYAAQVMDRVKALGLDQRCVTIDVPHAEVPRYMSCCDVLVLPSLSTERWKEQFGRVLPEAMACEVPVIGSSSGNIPHMIGEAGIIFPEGDADALGQAIASLARDPARRRELGKLGRERVRAMFSLEAQVDAMERLIEASS